MKKLRIGSRGSRLALVQSNSVKERLIEMNPGLYVEIVVIKTAGDKILDTPLAKIGDKGLFTKEIENELLAGNVDIAVHSMKDMPAEVPNGLTIAAVTQREDPSDAIVSKKGLGFNDLTKNTVLATGSLRRKAQLMAIYPGIRLVDIRGNVESRIKKMNDNPEIDACILAYAGLKRLSMTDKITSIIATDILIPAAGQGALAIETRIDDNAVLDLAGMLNHALTEKAVLCERAFLARLEGGCQVPIAAYAKVIDDTLFLNALISNIDGTSFIRDSISGASDDFHALGTMLAEKMLKSGGDKILEHVFGK
jgi:hydroxymethylbilane synthase